jgi:hypothetical protein
VAVSTPAPTTITIVGSAAMQRALRGLTDEFSRQNPNVLFSIRSGGSTIGEEEVAQGEADIGATTLPPPDVATAGVELMRTPVGINGLAIVVHPSNSVGDLSLVQLSDIFAGRVLDWQALGSDNGEIQLVSREDGSGSRRLFEERVMGDDRVSLTAVVMPSSADVAAYVAKRPDAIGYLSRGEVAGLFAARGRGRRGATAGDDAGRLAAGEDCARRGAVAHRRESGGAALRPDPAALSDHPRRAGWLATALHRLCAQPGGAGHHRTVSRADPIISASQQRSRK